MEKKFMVLGIKEFPCKDEKSEADNPYIFYSLERALEVAKEVASVESFANVVEIEVLHTINYGCQS